ncbi:MAG: hypothetical protein QXD43_04625, partial [Candidatus Aenigmatarchaeota archaeon]
MKIKDRILSWFLQNVILPGLEIIDKPGFIAERGLSERELVIREIFLPEILICELEMSTDRRELYQIGKKFGFFYSNFIKLPTISHKKDLRSIVYFLVRDIESIYARKLSHTVDFVKNIFKLKMKDYIICRKNGLGYIFSEGGIAGIWAYACEDPSIEAIQIKCQGRGDKECEVIAAPYKTLVRMGYKPIRCKKLEKGKLTPEYKIFNEIRPTSWARNSLKSLIDAGFFDYKHGQVTYRGERFFLCEASFMYILEKELKKIKNGLKILWDCSFDFGKRLAEISGKQEPCKFIMDFFPALGFGDILALKKKGRYEI